MTNLEEKIRDLFYYTVPNGNKFSNFTQEEQDWLTPKIKELFKTEMQECVGKMEKPKSIWESTRNDLRKEILARIDKL